MSGMHRRNPPRRNLPTVAADDWVSQQDAAHELSIGMARVAILVANGSLVAALSPAGAEGVTRSSLARERLWRREATARDRLRRAVRNAIDYF